MGDGDDGTEGARDGAAQVQNAELLRRLHSGDQPLILVNAWDVASAQALARSDGCAAIATASAAVASAHGYPDGQAIPAELMLAVVGRVAAAVDLPVTADLEAGYGDPGAVVRAALRAGAVGANIEDQMLPLEQARRVMAAVVAAGRDEGIPLVLNARTDAWLMGPAETALAEAVERGHAYLEAGADCLFVPGAPLEDVARVVGELGPGRVSAMWMPGGPTPKELAEAGACRISFGPFGQIAAMRALKRSADQAYAGAGLW